MKVSEVMTPDVRIASPEQTLEHAARIMGEIDAGVLPVAENDRLIGMITTATSPFGVLRRARGLVPKYARS